MPTDIDDQTDQLRKIIVDYYQAKNDKEKNAALESLGLSEPERQSLADLLENPEKANVEFFGKNNLPDQFRERLSIENAAKILESLKAEADQAQQEEIKAATTLMNIGKKPKIISSDAEEVIAKKTALEIAQEKNSELAVQPEAEEVVDRSDIDSSRSDGKGEDRELGDREKGRPKKQKNKSIVESSAQSASQPIVQKALQEKDLQKLSKEPQSRKIKVIKGKNEKVEEKVLHAHEHYDLDLKSTNPDLKANAYLLNEQTLSLIVEGEDRAKTVILNRCCLPGKRHKVSSRKMRSICPGTRPAYCDL